jgi:hypothetical protein
MAALIASISVLVLGSINVPSMIHAQNTNSTLSNATTAESHTINNTGTPFNTLLLLLHLHRYALQKISLL